MAVIANIESQEIGYVVPKNDQECQGFLRRAATSVVSMIGRDSSCKLYITGTHDRDGICCISGVACQNGQSCKKEHCELNKQ